MSKKYGKTKTPKKHQSKKQKPSGEKIITPGFFISAS
jgi:hypothetical protein